MEDTSSSDDDNLKSIIESVDTTFLPKTLYQKKKDSNKNNAKAVESEVIPSPLFDKKEIQKSQRYLECEEEFDTDLKVPSTMQEHFKKKLSTFINNTVEFIDEESQTNLKKIKQKKIKNRLKLLRDSDAPISSFDDNDDYCKMFNQNRSEIKRRIVEPENYTEKEKLELASVDPEFIISKKETETWSKRTKAEVFKYKGKSGNPLHFVEPENEFTKLRKKNCWSVKRIARKT